MHAELRKRAALSVRIRANDFDQVLQLRLDAPAFFGRDTDCHVVLPSPSVSRKHLSLFLREGGLFLRDHSSNGTRINGQLVHLSVQRVEQDAEIRVGPYQVTLLDKPSPPTASAPAAAALPALEGQPQRASIEQRRRIRNALLESLDLVALDRRSMNAVSLRPRVVSALQSITDAMSAELPEGAALAQLRDELCDEVLGLGPLEPLLRDKRVSEIMLVDASTIYVERDGRIELSPSFFTDDTAVRAAIERIVTPLGRRIDESAPLVDARLADGSRVNAVIPPLALKGPCITIRKFPSRRLTLEDLVRLGTLTRQMATFLSRAVTVRANLIIAGGTGSGKTTLLNVLSASIPAHERVVTIEDAAELQLVQRHVVSLESRPPNMEGEGAITIRDLVRNALRMRPDRIVVGECRGGEALDMLQAMNTGHDGSMTTTHANTPVEAVQRIETLCLMAGVDLPLSAIRRQIASSVNLVVQQARFSDGARRVTHISEVTEVSDVGEVMLRDIFRFEQTGTDTDGRVVGSFAPTGFIPSFVDRFVTRGLIGVGTCW